MVATVIGIEYDPNRSCHIALVQYEDGTKRYILAPRGLTDGDTLKSSDSAIDPKVGNCMPLKYIPTGLTVHNIEFEPGKGGALCRSAGAAARLSNNLEIQITKMSNSAKLVATVGSVVVQKSVVWQ
jgi:large subunit ribosomal protein L2